MNVWIKGSGCGRRRVLRGIHIDECLDKGKWMLETEGLRGIHIDECLDKGKWMLETEGLKRNTY